MYKISLDYLKIVSKRHRAFEEVSLAKSGTISASKSIDILKQVNKMSQRKKSSTYTIQIQTAI